MDKLENMTDELWNSLTEKERVRLMLGTKTIEVSGLIYQTAVWKAEDWGVSFDDALDAIFRAGMYELIRRDDIQQSAIREGNAIVYRFPQDKPDFRGQS